MASIVGPRDASAAQARPAARHVPYVAAAVAALAILLVHAETVRSIVAIWLRSETFTHGFVVVPIALWLAWRQRHAIAAMPARPFWPALGVVALAGGVWLLMRLADVQGVRQFALLFMVQASIVAVLGVRIARAALLPLAFLLFAVPAGEFLMPVLIEWTADFTVAALRLSGVPVYREANHFVIPSGAWSVVEACSGLRYLIASLMIGVVFAVVSYRSRWRKVAFIVAAIIVPLVANWLRAYMIVMIGHLSDNRLAVGVDHLIYGWLFFGIIMALLFWIGSLWTETPAGGAARRPPAVVAQPQAGTFAFVVASAAAVAIAGSAVAAHVQMQARAGTSPLSLGPVAAPAGFVPSTALPASWTPAFRGEDARLRQGFVRDGVHVGLHVLLYANQVDGRELITSTNQLVRSGDAAWRELQRGRRALRFDGREVVAARSVLTGERRRFSLVWTYWVAGHVTASALEAKAWLAWTRLQGRQDVAALVAVIAPEREGGDDAVDAFQALAPAVERALRTAGEQTMSVQR
jgi:exosortase A